VGYPAADPNTIAVGASTDRATLAGYSNVGPELDVVAPSSGGVQEISTNDVSYPGRGFNVGRPERGGADGLHTNDFGGTSSATPLAAGIGALVLSVNPKLDREAVRDILRSTADKIGSGYNARGHSRRFGYGRVNAARAVEAARGRRPFRPTSSKGFARSAGSATCPSRGAGGRRRPSSRSSRRAGCWVSTGR
jgi:subtilisin family serine protease